MTLTFRRLTALVVPLLVTLALGSGEGSPAATSSPSGHQLGHSRKMMGVGNFGEVTPDLFRGAQPTRKGFQALAKDGINIVVDT
ncbi:MAG: hypothetical protein WCD02_02855, partial [Terriglobales bacterium]